MRSYRELLLLLPPPRYTTLVSLPYHPAGCPGKRRRRSDRARQKEVRTGRREGAPRWMEREGEISPSVHAYSRRPKFRPGVRATTWHLDLAPATPHQPMDDGTSHDRANRSNGAVPYDARRPSPSRRARLCVPLLGMPQQGCPLTPEGSDLGI